LGRIKEWRTGNEWRYEDEKRDENEYNKMNNLDEKKTGLSYERGTTYGSR
jgi:hypothetical protein